MVDIPVEEGYVPLQDVKVWYRIVGRAETPGKVPLLCLHGGPGVPHDYLEPLEALAAGGRQVVFYDQLGCGNSDVPDDPSLWRMERFLEEIDAVRKALQLEDIHLLGQSWGGMLAMQYALRQPRGLCSLVLASAPASSRQWAAEAKRLREELPAETQETLSRHEEAGTTDDPSYVEAMMGFYRRHVCRLNPWPECLDRALEKLMRNPVVYLTMWGDSEFHVTGNLKDWDVSGRLNEIVLPTLLTSGRYDEATPAVMETIHQGIPGSKWVIFEQSAHEAHLEETERYLQVIDTFLEEVESRRMFEIL